MYTQRHNYTGLVFYFSSSGLFLQSSESLNCGVGYKSINKSCVGNEHLMCFNTICYCHNTNLIVCMSLKWGHLCNCSYFCNEVSFLIAFLADEDECETPNQCGDHAQCLNTHGSYNCTCKEGFLPSTPNITAITGQCSGMSEDCGI